MSTQAFCDAINTAIEAQRAQEGLTTVNLKSPNQFAVQALEANGARKIRDGWDQWCNSDTCNHNSHDPGQGWQEWEVASSWLDTDGASRSLFDYGEDDSPVLCILNGGPEGEPILFVTGGERHYASSTWVTILRPHAKAVLQTGAA